MQDVYLRTGTVATSSAQCVPADELAVTCTPPLYTTPLQCTVCGRAVA